MCSGYPDKQLSLTFGSCRVGFQCDVFVFEWGAYKTFCTDGKVGEWIRQGGRVVGAQAIWVIKVAVDECAVCRHEA